MDATPRKPDPARANGQDAILVLCDTYDTEAFWAAERLCGRGRRVDVVTASALDAVTRWEHRVGEHGTSIEAELPDGRRVSGRERQPILNRLFYAPTERLNRIGGADRDYAAQEMQALFLSWLHAMPGPMLNRPTPQGLGGNLRHPSAWTALAARAGLPVLPWKQSCETDPDAAWGLRPDADAVTAFVVGGRVAAPSVLPAAVREGCLRLARAAGEGLIGIDFVPRPGGWRMAGATPRPHLSRGGESLIDALDEALAA